MAIYLVLQVGNVSFDEQENFVGCLILEHTVFNLDNAFKIFLTMQACKSA